MILDTFFINEVKAPLSPTYVKEIEFDVGY